jgi:hypothetical protein
MRETRQSGSEGGEGSLPDPYHVFVRGTQDMDGRHKAGHDDRGRSSLDLKRLFPRGA